MSDLESATYRDAARSPAERTQDLLARMTLREKLAQLAAVWASDVLDGERFSADKAAAVLGDGTGQLTRLGATTTLTADGIARVVGELQTYLRTHTRLGIPAVVHEESCAGLLAKGATQFPQAIGLASTFEPALIERMAEVIREQMLAVGARQTLAPVLDIARDPRWGRCEETFGEDPYLAGRMGVAYVRGVQGDDLSRGVVATGKHFAGYSASEGGRNWGVAPIPRRELLERFVPPFEAAIREAGLASIMNGYHEIDGVPCGASRELLTDLLRGQLGFEGTVVADYFTVGCLLTFHRIAGDHGEAGARALEAGLDVELPARECFGEPLEQAIEAGRIDAALVDRAARRVLEQKFQLGLFDQPLPEPSVAVQVYDTAPQRELARELARKSMVLLHDDGGVLPLPKSLKTLAVIGPNADSVRNLQGDYSYPAHAELTFGPVVEPGQTRGRHFEEQLTPSRMAEAQDMLQHFTPHVTALAGIREAVGPRTEVLHAQGCELYGDDDSGMADAVAAAERADAAVVVVGGRSGILPDCTVGEGLDATDLRLTGLQAQLIERVAATGTPTVVVVMGGRVHVLSDVAPKAGALLLAWLPGEEGGRALADLLFGDHSPSGRLPVTLPRATGQVPLYYNHKPSGAICMFRGDYSDCEVTPLYAFGHGKSYTRFEYREVELERSELSARDVLRVGATIENVGQVAAEEVVQLYVRDRVGSVTRPKQELKGFARVALDPGQSRRVRFELPMTQLAFHDGAMRFVVEPGEVIVMVGAASDDIRSEQSVQVVGEAVEIDRADVTPTRVTVE